MRLGVGGVYRGTCGGIEHDPVDATLLASMAEGTVVDDAERDFAHDGAYFARDLRMAPVRDTTDAETYAALRRGRPYPQQSGRVMYPPR